MRAPPWNTGKVRPLWHDIENAAWGKEIKVHLEGCPTSCNYNTWKRQGINIKGVLCTRLGSKGCSMTRRLCHVGEPQHRRNSCHGCRCLGDMTVRVCKGLAIPRSCVIWLVQIASVRVYTPARSFADCFYWLVPIPRSQMSSSTDNSGRWGQLLLSQNGIPFLLQSLTLGVSYGLRID